jgi:hypothetical protein
MLITLKVDRATLEADVTDLKNTVFQSRSINQKDMTNQDIIAEELGPQAIDKSNWPLPVKDHTKKQEDKFILTSQTSKKKRRESMKK